ncbi:sulfur carrier protein ThiS [Luteibaculum oceani]|uniref:Sulfur carrier protein ThiS n=1 Tax=Luteibaculum oceani TaxID=1294296 RepID=A0A5C6V112_9FLAO|nr:sulfur carrier protein ThiS [Luteibaculum oceani]TXC78644.1 sulfur carrier protein ThiS [Luteibaculum oceani]
MQVYYNGEAVDLNSATKVSDFLALQSIAPNGVAVAINNKVIPKTNWSKTELKDQDKILVITAAQGG